MTYKTGDLINVEMDVMIDTPLVPGPDSTTQVREVLPDSSDRRWTHFIYLDSPSVTTEAAADSSVHVTFTARVSDNIGRYGTTMVTETGSGFNHYLFLRSEKITPVTETEPAAKKERKDKPMTEINGYNTIIDKSEVEARIGELEDGCGYDVVRTRNDEVLSTFDNEDKAAQYIVDEDYNPERVVVRPAKLDDSDAEELRGLRRLISDVDEDSDWTLYNADYFDADWARNEARDKLPAGVDFDAWPLDMIDWDDAAGNQRDALYPYEYTFDGAAFYGED